jgi:hypothetical protein
MPRFRIAGAIHHLARRLTRDQFQPVALQRALTLMGDLKAR